MMIRTNPIKTPAATSRDVPADKRKGGGRWISPKEPYLISELPNELNGFRPELVLGGQGKGVYHHIAGFAAGALRGDPLSDGIMRGQMSEDFSKLFDGMVAGNRGKYNQAIAEINGNVAGLEVGKMLASFLDGSLSKGQLREKLRERLCE